MFIFHLWITEGIENKAALSCGLRQDTWVWAHGQAWEQSCSTDTHLRWSCEGISPPPFQAQAVKLWAIMRANIFSLTNTSMKCREQSCLAGMITQHPEGGREAEWDRKNSSREKLGKPAQNFSSRHYLGRIMAVLYKRSNKSLIKHTLLLLGLIRYSHSWNWYINWH